MKYRILVVLTIVAALNLSAAGARPGALNEARLVAERQLAVDKLEAAKSAATGEKKSARDRLQTIEQDSLIAKMRLDELKVELLSVSAGKDMMLIGAVQADIEEAQAVIEAATMEKMLCLRRIDNADKEQDAWNKRMQSLDLSLTMGLKVMLASAREIENREKMLDAAYREIDYQLSEIRKYMSRRQNAVASHAELRSRKDELIALRNHRVAIPPDSAGKRFNDAIERNMSAVVRSIRSQQEWFLMNKTLETLARRSLSFARIDLKTKQEYAAALKKKESEQLARDLDTQAEKAGGELDTLRSNLDQVWAAVKEGIAKSIKEMESSSAALAIAATVEEQTAARMVCDTARARYAFAIAVNDFIDEYFSLRKANSGFAREKADRAKSFYENNTVERLNGELTVLKESARTSVEYVTGMKTVAQRLEDQGEAARREAGVTPEGLGELRKSIDESFRDHLESSRSNPQAMVDRISSLFTNAAASGSGPTVDSRCQDLAGRLVFTLARQTALRERLVIAELWLDNTRNAIRSNEKRIANLMWDQNDPRLKWGVFQEFGGMGQEIVSDAVFAKDALALGVAARAGYASGSTVAVIAVLLVILIAVVIALRRYLAVRDRNAGPWIVAGYAKTIPWVAAGLLLITILMPGNTFAALAGMMMLALSLRYLVYVPFMALCESRRFPDPASGTGAAFLRAGRTIVTAGAAALVLWMAAGHLECRYDIARVAWNLWLFVASLVGIRLLLAPSFLARFVLSRDALTGLRTAWGTVTVACLIAGALALAPVFLSLDNLARMVAGTVCDCLSAVAAAFVVLWVIELLMRRAGVQGRLLTIFKYIVRAAVVAGVVVSVGLFWWGLANDVVLSPDAPDFIRQAVAALAASWSVFLRGWGYDLGSGMTAGRLVWGLSCFIASFWVSSFTKQLFNDHLLSRTPMDETTRLTFSTVLGYLIVVTGFLVGLNVAGSSLKNLALLAGAITVGLGFGLQNVVNNFVSSLMIHFSRTIRMGDYIEVAGSRGKVEEIGFRNTRITTDDGVTVLVPNGAFVGGNIVNWTNPRRQARLHVPVAVLRQADASVVIHLLVDIASAHKAILKNPQPTVEIKSVAADKIGMDLLAWTGSPEAMSGIVGDLSLQIDKILREKNLLA